MRVCGRHRSCRAIRSSSRRLSSGPPVISRPDSATTDQPLATPSVANRVDRDAGAHALWPTADGGTLGVRAWWDMVNRCTIDSAAGWRTVRYTQVTSGQRRLDAGALPMARPTIRAFENEPRTDAICISNAGGGSVSRDRRRARGRRARIQSGPSGSLGRPCQ